MRQLPGLLKQEREGLSTLLNILFAVVSLENQQSESSESLDMNDVTETPSIVQSPLPMNSCSSVPLDRRRFLLSICRQAIPLYFKQCHLSTDGFWESLSPLVELIEGLRFPIWIGCRFRCYRDVIDQYLERQLSHQTKSMEVAAGHDGPKTLGQLASVGSAQSECHIMEKRFCIDAFPLLVACFDWWICYRLKESEKPQEWLPFFLTLSLKDSVGCQMSRTFSSASTGSPPFISFFSIRFRAMSVELFRLLVDLTLCDSKVSEYVLHS